MPLDENTQPVSTPDASAAVSAEAPQMTQPMPSVDPNAVTATSPAAPPDPQQMQDQMNAAVKTRQENIQQTQKIAGESTAPPPPGPHARLAAMVSGLMTGLDAFGKSIATGGREGGVQEVVQVQGEQQRQKLEAQQSRDASKNQRLQQSIMVGQALESNINNIHVLMTLKPEMTKLNMEAATAQQAYDITGAEFAKQNWGLTPAQVSGKEAPPSQTLSNSQSMLSRTIGDENRGALAVLGAKDPAVIEAQRVAGKSNPTPQEIALAGNGLIDAQHLSAATTEAKNKQATEQIASLKLQQDQGAQSTYTRTVAKNAAGQPVEDFATWQARTTKEAETKAAQGDPTFFGEMVADGLMTIPQVAVARNLDKQGFQQVLKAADAEAKRNGAPEIVVNGRKTGHYFNASAATQQYDYIKAFNAPDSKTQQGITAGSTFMEHASDLLEVNAKYARSNEKFLNTPLNKIKDQFGSEVYTEFVTALSPVRTEYDNALKAGFAPTVEDAKAVAALLSDSATAGQIEIAAKTMMKTVVKRLDSTNQGYATHTGVSYPNILTPNAADAAKKAGIDTGNLQSGGGFSGTPQQVRAGTSNTQPAPPASAASKLHTNLTDFKQATPTKEHGILYTDDGKIWYTRDGSIYGGK